VTYANQVFRAIADRKDAFRFVRKRIEFESQAARESFAAALASAMNFNGGGAASDFPVARKDGATPYFVSVRRLPNSDLGQASARDAVAIVFVRDPAGHSPVTLQILRDTYGFTEAEAALARAIQTGTSPVEYARERLLSPNTIYTHLRRIREKTGCRSLSELIARLNELHLPLRPGA